MTAGFEEVIRLRDQKLFWGACFGGRQFWGLALVFGSLKRKDLALVRLRLWPSLEGLSLDCVSDTEELRHRELAPLGTTAGVLEGL